MENNEHMNFSNIEYKATVELLTVDHETQTPIDYHVDSNVLTNEGAMAAMARLTRNSSDVTTHYVETIYLGDDVGTGTILSPEEADTSLTGNSQSIVYQVPVSDITTIYPNPNTSKISTVLNGTNIIETNFPNDIDMRFTSLTLRLASGTALAYIRFPVRSLSRLVDIQISWTITLQENNE